MPKKPRLSTLMDTSHVKVSERLPKSTQQYFPNIFWYLWIEISSNSSVLVVSEILKLFVNIFTPDDKYSLSVKANVSHNQFKCNYLQTKIYFLNFLLLFRNLNKIWNTFKKRYEPQSLFVSEIIKCEKQGYLKAQKAAYQNTYGQSTC